MGKDERPRSENRGTHLDCLLCVNENAFWKTLVSSKDREAPTTATLGVIECQRVKLEVMQLFAGRGSPLLVTAKKFAGFCRPTVQSFPDFL
jgi:hypothetical protein